MEFKKQVPTEHYDFCNYVDKSRWMSFYYQIQEILNKNPKSVCEIGAGKKFVGSILAWSGIKYETVDIDPELKPNYLASVTDLPLKDNSFDIVCCFQVLEHIPYEYFRKALTEIHRVARDYAIISLPDAKRLYYCRFEIPKIGVKFISFPRPRLKPLVHVFDGEHYWEINKVGYPLERIISDIKTAGFEIETTYRPPEFSYHRFFVLKC